MDLPTLFTIIGIVIASFVGLAAFFNTQQKKVLDSGRMLEKVDNIQTTLNKLDLNMEKRNTSTDATLRVHGDLLVLHTAKIEEQAKDIAEIKTKL